MLAGIKLFISQFKLYFAVGATVLVCFGLHQVAVFFDEKAHERELASQKKELTAQCKSNQKLTKETNDELQNKYDAIAKRLVAAKRVQESRCVKVISGIAKPQSTRPEHAGTDGISAEWLLDYAAKCESYRQERISLEEFYNRVRSQNDDK